MATSFNFNGRNISIPGVYTSIQSGVINPLTNLDYGTVLLIDTGSGAQWGGGAGVDGEGSSGIDSFKSFELIQDFRDFIKGGYWWQLASPLFSPLRGARGISNITYIRAATTTRGSLNFTFTGGGSNGGTLTIKTVDEGIVVNGVLATNGNLSKGYASIMRQGVIDTSKFILDFYVGTYRGFDSLNNSHYGEIDDLTAAPKLLVSSPEFDNVADLINWMNVDATFKSYFSLTSSTVNGNGSVDSGDLANYSSYNLVTGGTETYNTSLVDTILDIVTDKTFSFILSDNYGTSGAQSLTNFKYLDFIENTSKYKPELYVGGGNDINEFTFSKQTCSFFDSENVTVVHGGVKINTPYGERKYDSLYKACLVLGREAGLPPQVPITFKSIDIDGEWHSLTDKEVKQALDAGLVVTRLEGRTFDIVKGINTLQQNQFLVNQDGTTHSKQIRRIGRQLSKEVSINAKESILKDPNGVNRNTISEQDMVSWTIGFLRTKIAKPNSDNLILGIGNVTVTRQQDGYFINYEYIPNSEISFLFFTGIMIDV